MTRDTSGPTLHVPSAYYDHGSRCWKTSGVMFPSDWPTSSETCPAWGMTLDGELFELPRSVPPTDEPASSSSLLPTATARDGVPRGSQHPDKRMDGGHQVTLNDVAEHVLLPTPQARDWKDETLRPCNHRPGSTDSVPRAVFSLLPTPAVNDMGAGKTPEDWDAWTARMQEKHGNGNGHGASLSIEALRLHAPECMTTEPHHAPGDMALLPTPIAGDALGARNATAKRPPDSKHHAGTTLTDVFWIAGGHTDQPSPDGSSSSGDPHPTPPNRDATDDPDCLPFSSSGSWD